MKQYIPELSLFDVFSGCGGLSIGLNQAGFKPTWAVEHWKPASKTYQKNHPETKVFSNDAVDILDMIGSSESDLPKSGEVDILVGGPPCQGFCGINRHRSADDERNSMVDIFFQFVKLLQPRFGIMENVNGILSLEEGSAVKNLIENLDIIGYQSEMMVLQAGTYGVPQNRWRTFILFSKDKNISILRPKALHIFPRTTSFDCKYFPNIVLKPPSNANTLFDNYFPYITVSDAISDLPEIENGEGFEGTYPNKPSCVYQTLSRVNSKNIKDHQSSRLGPVNLERVMHLEPNSGQGWTSLPDHLKPKNLARMNEVRYKNRFGRLKWDYIFNTIMTKPEPYWGRVIHPDQNRVYSVRESARAQGFPDTYEFEGNLAEKYRQIGNAVPPPLGRAIGWEIRRSMGDKHVDDEINEYKNNFIE